MKINLNKDDLAKVQNLLQTNENNIQVSAIFNEYLMEYDKNITKKSLNKYAGTEKEKYSKALLYDEFNMKEASSFEVEVLQKHAIKYIERVNPKEYEENPYYQNININNKKYKKWNLHYDSYIPYELFPLDDLEVDEENFFLEKLKFGYMEQSFPFVAVSENDVIWMSVIPHEIETMKKGISLANGNIITFGLGLGYFAYIASLKEEVKSITIIEKNKDVISLFKQFILPQFKEKEKIHIIQQDAFSFLNDKNNFENISFVYVDIFHGAEDGIYSYLKFKKEEKKYPSIKFDYWLEESLIAYVRRTLISLIEESLQGYDDSDYKGDDDYSLLISSLYYKLKDYNISSYKDIQNLLSKKHILQLIKI
ncbi:MAG: hypothetical protein ACI4U5_06265 [Bacilli bacterium]